MATFTLAHLKVFFLIIAIFNILLIIVITNKKGEQAMKYREKVNKNVKKREIWKLLPWQQQIHHDHIITLFGEYHNQTSYNNFNI